jgi:hypothetical protein
MIQRINACLGVSAAMRDAIVSTMTASTMTASTITVNTMTANTMKMGATAVRALTSAMTISAVAVSLAVSPVRAAEPMLAAPNPQSNAEAAQTACTQEATNRKLVVSSVQSNQPLNTGVRLVMNVKNGAYAFVVGCTYTTANGKAALESVSLRPHGNWRGMGQRVREVCMKAARREGMKVLDVGTVSVNNEGGILNMQLRQTGIDFKSAQCVYTDASGQANFVLR